MNRRLLPMTSLALVALLSVAVITIGSPDPQHETPLVAMCEATEPGERLEFSGRVLDEHGRPLPKAAVIAYNTDATGLYTPRGSATRTPRIQGVAVTDAQGRYRFSTIKPAGYPGTRDPAHIHMHIDAAVHAHKYVTFWFDGDERLTPEMRRATDDETVIVTLQRRDDGVLSFEHDIRLRGS